jgi:ATP-dependent Clp protease ATP-binding subunit ClpA
MNPEPKWEPVTAGVQQLLIRAQEIMQSAQAPSMTHRHVALALINGNDKTAEILAKAVSKTLLENALQSDDAGASASGFELMLQDAVAEARCLSDNFIAPPHVALALFQPNFELRMALLPGVDASTVRDELEQATRDYPPLGRA